MLTIIVEFNTGTAHIHAKGCADVKRNIRRNMDGFTERFAGSVAELLPQMDALLDGDDLGWIYTPHVLPCALKV